jgi:hypothetical protein
MAKAKRKRRLSRLKLPDLSVEEALRGAMAAPPTKSAKAKRRKAATKRKKKA